MWPWSRIAHISAFSFLKENPASCRTRQLFCRCLVSCSYNTVLEEREHISCAVYTIRITCFNLSRKRILSIRQKSVKWVSWDIFGNKANLPFKKKKKGFCGFGDERWNWACGAACSEAEVYRHDCAFKTRRKSRVVLPVRRHMLLLGVKRAFAVLTGWELHEQENKWKPS